MTDKYNEDGGDMRCGSCRDDGYPPSWVRYGLSISHDIIGEKFHLAVDSHWKVAKYLDVHPLEIPQLFDERGTVRYFEVLERAEFLEL